MEETKLTSVKISKDLHAEAKKQKIKLRVALEFGIKFLIENKKFNPRLKGGKE